MSRLIDADEVIEYYETWEGEGVKVPIDVLLLNLRNQPTAYEPDKVVKQLEETAWEYESFGYEDSKVIDLVDAIEIVKSGGK